MNDDVIPLTNKKHTVSGILEGIGCSPGKCTGPACVIDSVLDSITIKPGHIIISPSIDPGLTPLVLDIQL